MDKLNIIIIILTFIIIINSKNNILSKTINNLIKASDKYLSINFYINLF